MPALCTVALLAGCSEKKDSQLMGPKPVTEAPKVVVDGDQIEFRGGIIEQEGLAYFEGNPFTGVAVWKYTPPNPNAQKWNEITYKDGKRHGLETYWYENGQKQSEHTHKDGIEHGPGAAWYENGQKKAEWNFKDRRTHGPGTTWYENGQKKAETTYKDSNLVTSTIWKPNGEKCPGTNVVNGTGIVFWYHENGQKMHELTYKAGKLISTKEWDEDGNTK